MLQFPFFRPSLSRQLESRAAVLPRLSHQRLWAERFASQVDFDVSLGSWKLLQKFTVPLLKRHGSQAHNLGLECLGLNQDKQITIEEFKSLVLSQTGWRLQECKGEVRPLEYFGFLSQRIFPYVAKLRPVNGVLCNDRPDFWHEAVGHIAPLVCPKISEFYKRCGEVFVHSPSKRLEKIFWVLLEFGFIWEDEKWKAFGAALTSSFVAMTKFDQDFWSPHDLECDQLLNSGLFDQGFAPRRDSQGRIIFYGLRDFDSIFESLGASC